MAQRLTRRDLYDLVWSEPMRTLAKQFSISDVALKKTCARAHIPTPDRGYWAKREAGKPTEQIQLPPRPPGMDDEINVGGGNIWYRSWTREEILGPIPPAPEFEETIETVRKRISLTIGKVTVPRGNHVWHLAIDRLLMEDEKRRQKQLASAYPFYWDAPLFDTPEARRCLRILNSLFLATAKLEGKPTIRGREARDIHITFHQQTVGLTLEPLKARTARGSDAKNGTTPDRLRLTIQGKSGPQEARKFWTDDETYKIESSITEISVEVALAAELQHREGSMRQHLWLIERKAQVEEEDRKSRAEAERLERERQQRLEQARIDRLLKDASAFQQAVEIRNYVAVLSSQVQKNGNADITQLERWRTWALAQADRIDPSLNGAYLNAEKDRE